MSYLIIKGKSMETNTLHDSARQALITLSSLVCTVKSEDQVAIFMNKEPLFDKIESTTVTLQEISTFLAPKKSPAPNVIIAVFTKAQRLKRLLDTVCAIALLSFEPKNEENISAVSSDDIAILESYLPQTFVALDDYVAYENQLQKVG